MLPMKYYVGQKLKFYDQVCENCGNNTFEVTELIPLCDAIKDGGHTERCLKCGDVIEIGLE